MFCTFNISFMIVLLIATQLSGTHGKPFAYEPKICKSLAFSIQKDAYDGKLLKKWNDFMKTQVNGCQYVDGDVKIESVGVNLKGEPLDGFDHALVDCFDSVEEIAGKLVIGDVNIGSLSFRNLRVIRGSSVINSNRYKVNPAMLIYNVHSPMILILPKLTAIAGNVELKGSLNWRLHSFLTLKVDWDLVFKLSIYEEEELIGQLKDLTTKIIPCKLPDCKSQLECSHKCKGLSQISNCWSDGPEGCQNTRHRCLTKSCTACYLNRETGMEHCCSDRCLGGCSGGGTPASCNVCKNYNCAGTCADRCFGVGKLWPMLDHLCVNPCPLPYLKKPHELTCVSHCSDYEMPVNGACERCDTCNKVCQLRLGFDDSGGKKLKENKCQLWKSPITVIGNKVAELRSRDSRVSMMSLRAFYGALYITGLDKFGFTGIELFKNLEFVSGPLKLYNMKVRYLGLSRLRYAYVFALYNIKGLCPAWYPARHIEAMKKVMSRVSIKEIEFADKSSDGGDCDEAACHEECRGSECWGPGADMCVVPLWTGM